MGKVGLSLRSADRVGDSDDFAASPPNSVQLLCTYFCGNCQELDLRVSNAL